MEDFQKKRYYDKRVRRRKRRRQKMLLLFSALFFVLFLGNRILGAAFSKNDFGSILSVFRKHETVLAGQGVPDSLIELMKNNPEAQSFVEGYPENHRKDFAIELSEDLEKGGTIPLLLQWDQRWGYRKYGGDFFALNGCGPTCLSMVCLGLTGNTKWNPYRVAEMAEENGYYVRGEGTSWELMRSGAEKLGLRYGEMVFEKSKIIQTLAEGKPVICAMRKGDFTSAGHFIVLTGVAEDGSIIVNDPNSRERSKKRWELDRLMPQMKNLWCYEAER